MTLRKAALWLFRLLLLAAVIAFALWAYRLHQPVEQPKDPEEFLDIDKECWMVPDTGQCLCRHRWTDERLLIPYAECVALTGRR